MVDGTIGFIGAGQMAQALAQGFVDAQLVAADRLVACDPAAAACEQFTARCPGSRIFGDSAQVLGAADIVVLAVKPQVFGSVADGLRGSFRETQLAVSVMAGIPLQRLCEDLGTRRVIRVMPNTPCLVCCGASAYALGPEVQPEDAGRIEQLMAAVGIVFPVEERLLDAVTGLSGSGPAFVYQVIEALSDGGVQAGLPRSTATSLAAQTVAGAARMVLETGEHPAVLKDRVASPGGTTIAGLQAMERHGVRAAMMAAVEAASKRSIQLRG